MASTVEIKTNIGHVSAYAIAKAHGYTGTEEEWAQEQANAANNAQAAARSAKAAEDAKAAAAQAETDAEKAKQAAEAAAKAAAEDKESADKAKTAAETAATNASGSEAEAGKAKAAAAESAEAAAASEKEVKRIYDSIPEDYTILSDKVTSIEAAQLLLATEIPDTVQSYVFAGGSVSQVLHKREAETIRTDVYTYGKDKITEVRTLSSGESLTIETILSTLVTTVTHSN